jgi:dipeptidase E
MFRILALSSSRSGNGGYLESALPYIKEFLGDKKGRVAFIPFASVDRDYDHYLSMVQEGLASLSLGIVLVNEENATTVLKQSDVIMVGGGNTFKLLHDLYALSLLETIQEKIKNGTPYIGWSAGANISGCSIATTNDMPIIQPAGFSALGFLPFQINPHYLNQQPKGFHGETRDQRLMEFIRMNSGSSVVGLPEGTALVREGKNLRYLGTVPAVLFHMGEGGLPLRRELPPNEDLSFLLSSSLFADYTD